MLDTKGLFTLALIHLLSAAAMGAEKVPSSPLITRENGDLPIILSAPHGGTEAVPGASERVKGGTGKFVKLRDADTDVLAFKLADEIGRRLGVRPYLVVARFHRKFVDANRAPEGAYESETARAHYEAYHAALRAAVDAIRKKWGRGLLIDVHGQSAENDIVLRGTINGKTVKRLVKELGREAITGPDSIAGRLETLGYNVQPPCSDDGARETRYVGGFILDTYSAGDTGIDAIQFEFGREFRTRGRTAKTAADLAEAVAAFAEKYLPLRAPVPAGQ